MIFPVEEVFRTEGIPEFTFVKPPNFNEILVDIRTAGKPVIIEGQSGTGKTTTVKKIIEEFLGGAPFDYLSARKAQDMPKILDISDNKLRGNFIIDDFHRLSVEVQEKIANLIKISAEQGQDAQTPKVVIIGINKVGSDLIRLVHDIAKRCGIHRIQPASPETTSELIRKGEDRLNIQLSDHAKIFAESKGDYWLTQLVCQSLCLLNDVTSTATEKRVLVFDQAALRAKVITKLEHNFQEPVKEFCRGKRFRATNDPYLKVLRAISEQESSIVDLTELANANQSVRGSINNIKESRLSVLLESKPICERYFYYNPESKLFAIEDPALFYYIKHLDWEAIKRACGFRIDGKEFEFDFAISFAGENRELAKEIVGQLLTMDCSVFFDELFEANYLGKAWHKEFNEIFARKSRFVICLLDEFHEKKIWPTFERECFAPRVAEAAVIPIYLDKTVFVGIPRDVVGIPFDLKRETGKTIADRVTDEVTFKLMALLDDQ